MWFIRHAGPANESRAYYWCPLYGWTFQEEASAWPAGEDISKIDLPDHGVWEWNVIPEVQYGLL